MLAKTSYRDAAYVQFISESNAARDRMTLGYYSLYAVSQKKIGHFFARFRKDLRRKFKLKLLPPLKSVVALPCEIGVKW